MKLSVIRPPSGQHITLMQLPKNNQGSKCRIDETVLNIESKLSICLSLRLRWRRCDVELALRKPLISVSRGSFARLMSIVEMGKMLGDWHLQHSHLFLKQCPCVFALEETDNWRVTEMKVTGYVCYGWDDGRAAILCQVCRSWECHERCTAILIGCLIVLFVCMGGRVAAQPPVFSRMSCFKKLATGI